MNKTKSELSLNGNEGFYFIYRGLFEDFLNFDKIDYEVLEIFAAIRNTIHNSGIYFSPHDEKSPSFNYRKKTYTFIYGKPVNFITIDFIKNMLFDLLDLWEKLLKNNIISNIGFIKDPIADVKFE